MALNRDLATLGSTATEQKANDPEMEGRSQERNLPLIPAVDIFEDAHQMTVQAEMPGVSKTSLNVRADRNSLLIEGDIALDMRAGMAALYADLQTTKYRRSFVLSSEFDTEHIAANLKDGLLTVRIPKRPEFRTHKIKVEVA